MRAIPFLTVAAAFACSAPNASAQSTETLEPNVRSKAAVAEATPAPRNLVYTPIATCRVFFTARLAAGGSQDLQVTGNGNLSGQGGPTAGCGIPSSARAVAINVTAASPTSTGVLKLLAAGAATTSFSTLSYRASQNITSSSIVALSSDGRLTVSSTGATKVVGDVTGYFEAQLHVTVNGNGSIEDSSGRVVSVVRTSTGRYNITFDRDVTGCGLATSSPILNTFVGAGGNGSFVSVGVGNQSGTAVDAKFRLHVSC